MVPYYMDNRSNSRANTCPETVTHEAVDLLDQEPTLFEEKAES